ncbi:MAG: FAD-dependent oxidoreductase [Candidatus Zixiibacteriota bacterium]
MDKCQIQIDGRTVECHEGDTILKSADAAEIYIARLCHHPDLPPANEVIWSDAVYQAETRIVGDKPGISAAEEAHCNLCLVEVEGQPEPVRACITQVENGMVVHIDTTDVVRLRQQALSRILANHPHACLTCAQKVGCSRTDCSSNVPVEERCCSLLGRCELEKVSDFIGIPAYTPKYTPKEYPVVRDDPLFDRDFNLCIGCLRCVRICNDVRGVHVLGAAWKDSRVWVGTLTGGSLREAQCRFCGACVEVCPTGALLDKEGIPPIRREAPVPCVGNCPAGIDIPRYVRAIAEGRYQEALDIIRDRAPLPGALGYVCFHPCEDVCRRREIDQAVAICDLKRFVADIVPAADSFPIQRCPDTGKKVAVIGSGPAGVTAAYYLGLLGHSVSVFDRESRPGGMLCYGIPDYRLPPEVVQREMKALETLGVSFHMSHRFDSENWVDDLKAQGFGAVLIATGASLGKALLIENSDLDGIYSGLEFLKSAKLSQQPRLNGRVVVIGGGNVAIDAAMTAMRLGARSVCLVCLESREEMPAHDWEIAQAEEEGIEIHPSWGPSRFIARGDRLSGVDLKRCTSVFDAQGQFNPQFDDNETWHLPADSVIVAVGQQVDAGLLPNAEDLPKGPGNTVKVDESFTFGLEGVFAAGDMIRGPSSVVDAVADGRRVADVIDKYLGGNGFADVDQTTTECDQTQLDASFDLFQQHRHDSEVVPAARRRSGFGLIRQTFTEQQARAEAERCLQCHLRQNITPVVLPPESWRPLSKEAVDSVPEVGGAIQLLNAEKKVIRIMGVPNMRQSLSECLKNPGDVRWVICEEDPMYTKRESELIQQYLQEHGELPGGGAGGDDLDDLY